MPRIDAIKFGMLWIAFTVNDFGDYGKPRVGRTRERARMRVYNHSVERLLDEACDN
jgi:hypothetical protein